MRRSIFWPAIEQFGPLMDGENTSGNNESSGTGTSTGESGGKEGEGTQGGQSSGSQGESGKETSKTYTQDELEAKIEERFKRERTKIAREERDKIEQEARDKAAKEQGDFKTLYDAATKELDELKAEKAKRENEDLRKRICREAKLPESMYMRLVGETEDELKADAKELAKSTKVSDPPDGDQGKTRSKTVSEDKDFEALKKPGAWNLPYR